jgi:hypothetical protein
VGKQKEKSALELNQNESLSAGQIQHYLGFGFHANFAVGFGFLSLDLD